MVCESTMICFDNSDFMRNGDYIPTRLHAQKDAVIDICYARHRLNAQNELGLMTLADVKIIASLTNDIGTIICRLQDINVDGRVNLEKGIRVAHMALRHRPEKYFKMRIILFIGSPAKITVTEIVQIGKILRKENVNIDIVSFGEINQNEEILSTLFNSVSGREGRDSHYLKIVGPDMIEELKTTPIMVGQPSITSSPHFSEEMANNIDDMNDQDLIMALELSLAEENRRQENLQRPTTTEVATGETDKATITHKRKHVNSVASVTDFSNMTEEEQIAYAVRLSMEQDEENKRKILKTEKGECSKDNNSDTNNKNNFPSTSFKDNDRDTSSKSNDSDDSSKENICDKSSNDNCDTSPKDNNFSDKKCASKNITKKENPKYGENSKSNTNSKDNNCSAKESKNKETENKN